MRQLLIFIKGATSGDEDEDLAQRRGGFKLAQTFLWLEGACEVGLQISARLRLRGGSGLRTLDNLLNEIVIYQLFILCEQPRNVGKQSL